MASTFPTTLDTFVNPSPSDLLENATDTLDHHQQHNDAANALLAVEGYIGVDSSPATGSLEWQLQAGRAVATDFLPANPNSEDDEFLGTSLSGSWSTINSGSGVTETITVSNSWCMISMPANVSAQNRFIVKTIPNNTGNWMYAAKLIVQFSHAEGGTTNIHSGIYLRNSSTSRYESWGMIRRGSGNQCNFDGYRWTAPNTVGTNQGAITANWRTYYVAVERSGTAYNYYLSDDGIAWAKWYTVTISGSFVGDVDQIGFGIMVENTAATAQVSCDWIRKIA